MGILLTDKHVERAITLLALISVASNPVEVTRYQHRLIDLHREHPELRALTLDDPRIPAKVAELREAFDGPAPGFYLKCGLHWNAVTFGLHGSILACVSASPEHATRFDSWNYADACKQRLEAMPFAAIHDIVEVK